jgi:hypothetical protein
MRKTSVALMLLLAGTLVVQADETRPFRVEIQVTDDTTAPGWVATCRALGYDSGFQAARSGQGTHMGLVTSLEQGCLSFAELPIMRSDVWLTIRAANGDTVNVFAQAAFDLSKGGDATGTYAITGGTGRFTEAVGRGALGNIVENGNPGFTIILAGSIAY